jgi:hypothetical protein
MSEEQSGSGFVTNGHGSSNELRNYTFDTLALTKKLSPKDKGRQPLVLCACGSFSPITYCKFGSGPFWR